MTGPRDEQGSGFPPIIVGGWQLSAGHRRDPVPRGRTVETLVELVEAGFTAFDCADIYTGVEETFGELRTAVHERLGREAASGLRFHTKLVPDRSDLGRVDRAYVERIVDRSLERLRTDRLDLVQFAWWDYDVPGYVETALWLDELREAGKVRQIGVTNFDVPRLTEILDARVPVVANQLQYSVLDRRPENGMAELCRDRGIAMLCYGSLAGGFLSDRYLGAPDPLGDMENRSLTKYRLIIEDFGGWDAYQQVLVALRAAADEAGADIAQCAIAAVLAEPGVVAAIVGMSRPDRMRAAAAAAHVRLSESNRRALRQLAATAPGPMGDCFELERIKGGRHAAVMKYDLNQESTGSGVGQ